MEKLSAGKKKAAAFTTAVDDPSAKGGKRGGGHQKRRNSPSARSRRAHHTDPPEGGGTSTAGGFLVNGFSPGWGDSRTSAPLMSKQPPSPQRPPERSESRTATTTESAPSGGGGWRSPSSRGGALSAEAGWRGSRHSPSVYSPRSRPRGGFVSDAYLAFISAQHAADDCASPSSADGEGSDDYGREQGANGADVREGDGQPSSSPTCAPSSPGAPGTQRRDGYVGRFFADAKDGSSSVLAGVAQPPKPRGRYEQLSPSDKASLLRPHPPTSRSPSGATDGVEFHGPTPPGSPEAAAVKDGSVLGGRSGGSSVSSPASSPIPPRGAAARRREKGGDGPSAASVAFAIHIRDICAFGVPNGDAEDGTPTDPYARFSLLETDVLHLSTRVLSIARTTVATGDVINPKWTGRRDQLTLPVPAGSPLALSLFGGAEPVVRVNITDADDDNADDVLAEADVLLPLSRAHEYIGECKRVCLRGLHGLADCRVSFSYEVTTHLSTPAATITLRELRCGALEALGKPFATITRDACGATRLHLRVVPIETVTGGGRRSGGGGVQGDGSGGGGGGGARSTSWSCGEDTSLGPLKGAPPLEVPAGKTPVMQRSATSGLGFAKLEASSLAKAQSALSAVEAAAEISQRQIENEAAKAAMGTAPSSPSLWLWATESAGMADDGPGGKHDRGEEGGSGLSERGTSIRVGVLGRRTRELGKFEASSAATLSYTTASTVRWDDVEWDGLEECVLRLGQPSGAPRPPSVRIELWDSDLAPEHNPLAVGDVRLGEVGGKRTLTLRATHQSLRDVEVAFAFEVKNLPAAA
jgi:hypothetical protein